MSGGEDGAVEEKLKWDQFDAIEMARFLNLKVDEVKRMTPRDLCAATMRQISVNARVRRGLPLAQQKGA